MLFCSLSIISRNVTYTNSSYVEKQFLWEDDAYFKITILNIIFQHPVALRYHSYIVKYAVNNATMILKIYHF
jgi:hypothetical protein